MLKFDFKTPFLIIMNPNQQHIQIISNLFLKSEPLNEQDKHFLKDIAQSFNTAEEFVAFSNELYKIRRTQYNPKPFCWEAVDTFFNAYPHWKQINTLSHISSALQTFKRDHEESPYLQKCPSLKDNHAYLSFILSNHRIQSQWIRTPLNEQELQQFMEQEHNHNHYYRIESRKIQEQNAREKMMIWQHIHQHFLSQIPFDFFLNEFLEFSITFGYPKEAELFIQYGASFNYLHDPKYKEKVEQIYHSIFISHCHQSLFNQELTDLQIKILELAKKANIPEIPTSFFSKNPYFLDSPSLGRLALNHQLNPTFIMSSEAFPFWVAQHSTGWTKKTVGTSMNPITWALNHGLSLENFQEGMRQVFLKIQTNKHHYGFLKAQKIQQLLAFAHQAGFEFKDTDPPMTELVRFAIDKGCKEDALTSLRKIKASFIDTTSNNMIEYYFIHSKKMNNRLSFLVKIIEETLIQHGEEGRRQLLFQKFDKNSTLLHLAAKHLNYEAIAYLASQGLDIHAQDEQGNTPFHYAAKRYAQGTEQAIKKTIETFQKLGFDWKIKNEKGQTGMMVLARNGTVENILKLMHLDPSLFSINDNQGKTMMDLMQNRTGDVISQVEREGLDLNLRSNTSSPQTTPSRKTRL